MPLLLLALSGMSSKLGVGAETASGCNARLLSQSGLRLLEVDAAIAANTPAKFVLPARPVLNTPSALMPFFDGNPRTKVLEKVIPSSKTAPASCIVAVYRSEQHGAAPSVPPGEAGCVHP